MSDPVTTNGQTVPVTLPQDSIWDHPGAVAGVAIATALALAGTLYLTGAFSDTGDEPPIRVKGGSVELYLASSREKFKQKDAKHFEDQRGQALEGSARRHPRHDRQLRRRHRDWPDGDDRLPE